MAGLLPIGQLKNDPVPLAAFFWSLKRDQVDAWRAAGLNAWRADVARVWPEVAPLLESITDAQHLTFARYDHFTLNAPFGEQLVHIGDAAHATSPQLGQGANMALVAGTIGKPLRSASFQPLRMGANLRRH